MLYCLRSAPWTSSLEGSESKDDMIKLRSCKRKYQMTAKQQDPHIWTPFNIIKQLLEIYISKLK